jgi:hypothetical protein
LLNFGLSDILVPYEKVDEFGVAAFTILSVDRPDVVDCLSFFAEFSNERFCFPFEDFELFEISIFI